MHLVAFALAAVMTMTTAARAEHYDVYILAGQSNMDGRGHTAELTGELAHWTAPQPDVRYAYSDSTLRNRHFTSEGWITLRPGYSVPPPATLPHIDGLPTGFFGPELSFGRTIADGMPGRHVAILKFAEGGTSLKTDWRVGEKGAVYDQMLAFIATALGQLKENGDTYELRGFVWHQGENDAKETQAAYAELLTHLIQQLRTDLAVYPKAAGSAELPVVIGEVYDNHERDTVRAAQKQVAGEVPACAFASAEGLQTQDHGTHFNAGSQIELGKRMAAAMLKLTGK